MDKRPSVTVHAAAGFASNRLGLLSGELLSVADETALYNTLSLNQLKLALSDNGAKHMLRGAATKALLLETVAKSLAAASTRKVRYECADYNPRVVSGNCAQFCCFCCAS
jgi:hypothetical protein